MPSKIFAAAVPLLSIDTYGEEMLTGYVVSAGGLGESLVWPQTVISDLDTRCINGFG